MFVPSGPISSPQRRAEFVEYLKTLGPGDECVYWPWSDVRHTYSRISIGGKKTKASRWVYEQVIGPLPPRSGRGATGILVCHTCDNPPCCRPSHLVAADCKFNLSSAAAKGRMSGGERNGRAKITAEDVARIRDLASHGVQQRALAKSYGISQTQTSRIVRGESWPKEGD